jgi:hypothetical protein
MSGRVHFIVGLTSASCDLSQSSYVNDSDLTIFPYGDITLKCPTALGKLGNSAELRVNFRVNDVHLNH